MSNIGPGMILLIGSLLIPLLRGTSQRVFLVLLPLASLAHLLALPTDLELELHVFGQALTPVRIDALSLVWGYVFHIAAILASIYALHLKDNVQHVAAAAYAGSAIAAAFAGDLLTLFVFWELTALTSVFLIWARRTQRAQRAAMRYLLIQIGSGVLLLAGVLLHFSTFGSLDFGHIGTSTLAGKLIFLAFGIKCAFPLLHSWLPDTYPEATVTGTVVLSAFTTKLAVYALARGFAGTELMVPIGVCMTLYPILYAVIVNDLRRVLTYSLNNQLGFMVVGVGIGTPLALNGAAAHAFAHIIYKALLFMAMGAVLFRTNTIRGSELGGLYKSMPWTTVFCIIGSLSISGVPLFSGFVTKSMTLTAVSEGHLVGYSLLLLVASAGVFHHSGIKIPFFSFFAHDSGIRVKEAPRNMLCAMALAAAICIGIGVYPDALYRILPYPVDYQPYTPTHVMTMLQLLTFAALAFSVMYRSGWYPPELRAINLDVDWVYRRLLPRVYAALASVAGSIGQSMRGGARQLGVLGASTLTRWHKPPGKLGEPWTAGTTTLWAALILALCIMLYGL